MRTMWHPPDPYTTEAREVCPVRRHRDQLSNRRADPPIALVTFVDLIKRHTVLRVAMLGAGQDARRCPWPNMASMSSAWTCPRRCSPSLVPHIRTSSSKRVSRCTSDRTGVLAGAVCWYSIIHTPPDQLAEAFGELARVLIPGGYLLLGFQAEGEPVHRADAQGTNRRSPATGTACKRLPVGWRTQVSRSTPRFSGHLNWTAKPPPKGSLSFVAHFEPWLLEHRYGRVGIDPTSNPR